MKKWKIRLLRTFIILVTLTALSVMGIAYYFSDVIIHNTLTKRASYYQIFPDREPTQVLRDYHVTEYEKLTPTTTDGLRLNTLYFPSRNKAVIMAHHGYKATYSEMIGIAALLQRHGYSVILPERRAHGSSDGELISFGYYEMQDFEATYRYLLTRPDIDPERIGAIGNSMGGVLSILYAAQNPKIKAIVAHCPYASMADTLEVSVKKFTGLPPIPFAPLIKFFVEQQLGFSLQEVAPIAKIRQLSPRPVFILSSGLDTYINPTSGQKLYEAAGEPREFWFEATLDHVQFYKKRPEEFERRIIAFFDKYLL